MAKIVGSVDLFGDVTMHDSRATPSEVLPIAFLTYYQEQIEHQRGHDPMGRTNLLDGQPNRSCWGCLYEGKVTERRHEVMGRWAWAVPDHAALRIIADHSPRGVVEIGAGGGYWAYELGRRGVDVVAYDPDPDGTGEHPWHAGQPWSTVHEGDHHKVTEHPDRTLLLVWPSYSDPWAADAVAAYEGDTIVYVGEGAGGCTGDDRLHSLLGESSYCWHDEETEECDCDKTPAQWREVADHGIPQWWGIHDRLHVYKRV